MGGDDRRKEPAASMPAGSTLGVKTGPLVLARDDWRSLLLLREHVGLLELVLSLLAALVKRMLGLQVAFQLLGVSELRAADFAFHGLTPPLRF
jgi:hypothetical protein